MSEYLGPVCEVVVHELGPQCVYGRSADCVCQCSAGELFVGELALEAGEEGGDDGAGWLTGEVFGIGPPGCGKSILGEQICDQTRSSCLSLSDNCWVYAGVGGDSVDEGRVDEAVGCLHRFSDGTKYPWTVRVSLCHIDIQP